MPDPSQGEPIVGNMIIRRLHNVVNGTGPSEQIDSPAELPVFLAGEAKRRMPRRCLAEHGSGETEKNGRSGDETKAHVHCGFT